jgi:transcriptional regulator with XRE-family HTH domain
MSIHARIKQARIAKNLSVNALSKRLNVSSTAAWNWDHGHTTPRPEMLDKIASVLEVDIDFLRTGQASEQARQPSTVAEILAEAKHRIAEITGLARDQVRLELNVLA